MFSWLPFTVFFFVTDFVTAGNPSWWKRFISGPVSYPGAMHFRRDGNRYRWDERDMCLFFGVLGERLWHVHRPERSDSYRYQKLIITLSEGLFIFLLTVSHHVSCVCVFNPSINMTVSLKGLTAIHQQQEQKEAICVSFCVCVCVCAWLCVCVCDVIELYHCAISRNQCCCATWWL